MLPQKWLGARVACAYHTTAMPPKLLCPPFWFRDRNRLALARTHPPLGVETRFSISHKLRGRTRSSSSTPSYTTSVLLLLLLLLPPSPRCLFPPICYPPSPPSFPPFFHSPPFPLPPRVCERASTCRDGQPPILYQITENLLIASFSI